MRISGYRVGDVSRPENPWALCPWFTRDYGHFSPSPFAFLKQPWTLPKGKAIRLRYRVVLQAGTPQQAGPGCDLPEVGRVSRRIRRWFPSLVAACDELSARRFEP